MESKSLMKSLNELSSEIDSLDDLIDTAEDHIALMQNNIVSVIAWVKKVKKDNDNLIKEIKDLQTQLYKYKVGDK